MENISSYLVFISLGMAILAMALSVFAFLQTRKLKKFYTELFAGKKVDSLEKVILNLTHKTKRLDKDIEDLFTASNQINKLSKKGLNKIGMSRFNPFGEKGHKDCFSIALMNSKQDGIIFSTLTTDHGTKVFLKRIIDGKTDVQLTKEEELAMKSAK